MLFSLLEFLFQLKKEKPQSLNVLEIFLHELTQIRDALKDFLLRRILVKKKLILSTLSVQIITTLVRLSLLSMIDILKLGTVTSLWPRDYGLMG
jgi:hypothetical protein